MKSGNVFLLASLFLTLELPAVLAQSTVIRVEKVAVSRVLAGHADVGITPAPAGGVTVELCSSGWQTVLAVTKTDAKGYFFLDKPKTESLFYLRLLTPGVNTYELRVRIKKKGPPELKIHLIIAT